MAIIRRADAEQMAKSAVVLDLVEVRGQAEGVLAAARAEAQAIVHRAREQAEANRERVRQEAHAEGHAKGLEEGRKQGAAEAREQVRAELAPQINTLAEQWGRMAQAVERDRESLLADARADLVRLSIAVAEAVVKRSLETDEAAGVRNAMAAVERMATRSAITFRVSRAELDAAQEWLDGVIERGAAHKGSSIVADPALTPGSCLVQTDGGGRVDATIAMQIARIAEALLPGRPTAIEGEPPRVVHAEGDVSGVSPGTPAAPNASKAGSDGRGSGGDESDADGPDA